MPLAGVDANWYVSPRLGFAWDVRGTRRDRPPRRRRRVSLARRRSGAWAGLVDFGAGVKVYRRRATYTLTELDALDGDNVPFGGNAVDHVNDNKQPRTYTWSLTVNQRLPWSMNLELGYVGNRQQDQANSDVANINAVPLGAMWNDPDGNNNAYRPCAPTAT